MAEPRLATTIKALTQNRRFVQMARLAGLALILAAAVSVAHLIEPTFIGLFTAFVVTVPVLVAIMAILAVFSFVSWLIVIFWSAVFKSL